MPQKRQNGFLTFSSVVFFRVQAFQQVRCKSLAWPRPPTFSQWHDSPSSLLSMRSPGNVEIRSTLVRNWERLQVRAFLLPTPQSYYTLTVTPLVWENSVWSTIPQNRTSSAMLEFQKGKKKVMKCEYSGEF